MFRMALGTMIAVVAMAAATASADPGLPGTGTGKANKAAPVAHHGMSLHIKLNASVSDGQDANFSLTISKTGGQTVQFLSTAIAWSYEGKAPMAFQFSKLSDLSPTPSFVYASKSWIKLPATTASGTPFTMTGKVKVANRAVAITGADTADSTVPADPDAMFFCVQATVMASYPGKPNATWYEQSNMSCSQYSVG